MLRTPPTGGAILIPLPHIFYRVNSIKVASRVPTAQNFSGPPLPPGIPGRTSACRGQIWTSYGKDAGEAGGQHIGQPFQMVDPVFRPEGASDSMYVLDRVDPSRVAGLRERGTVQILYSSADPAIARMVGGTPTYPRSNLIYLLGLLMA